MHALLYEGSHPLVALLQAELVDAMAAEAERGGGFSEALDTGDATFIACEAFESKTRAFLPLSPPSVDKKIRDPEGDTL